MPAERIGMRDAREIIRLKFSCVSTHEIARRLGRGALDGAGDAEADGRRGLSWPLPEDMTDEALEAALYAGQPSVATVGSLIRTLHQGGDMRGRRPRQSLKQVTSFEG
jgi:hypothetical protein